MKSMQLSFVNASFIQVSAIPAYTSQRDCVGQWRSVPYVFPDVDLTGWCRPLTTLHTVFDLNTVSLLINIYVCLISWPLSLLHLTVSACTQGRR